MNARRRLSQHILGVTTTKIYSWPPLLKVGWICIFPWALSGLLISRFIVELPLHLTRSSTSLFTQTALKDNHGSFVESYASFIRRQRLSVVTSLALLLGVTVQLSLVAFGLSRIIQPTTVLAQSGSVDINPTYDDTAVQTDHYADGFSPCTIDSTVYSCDGNTSTSLRFGRAVNPPSDCSLTFDVYIDYHRPFLTFSLASIPDNATITGASLIVNVLNSSNQQVTVEHPSTDTPQSLSCIDSGLFAALSGSTFYGSATWSSAGSKTLTLNGSAVSDIQTRITGSDVIALSLHTTESTNDFGDLWSADAGTPSNRPILRVTYTIPPSAPTGTSHSAITTSTITWTWTDNATSETRYDVKDQSNANVTGCTNLAANSQSCTETGLSANTQYTRHPNVTDADGNTDGPTASAYTAIQTPTGVTKDSASQTSFTVHASGTLANLSSGQSALWFEDSTTSTNSGWITSNTWTKSGLSANTLYHVRVKARNGDGVETSFTSYTNISTAATTPTVDADRATSTWYNTPTFTFTDTTVAGTLDGTWDQIVTHTFPDPSFTALVDNPFTETASVDGSWYLHIASYDLDGGLTGGTDDLGPYYFDGTPPTTPSSVTVNSGATVTSSTTELSASWTASTDLTSGLQKYQYAIGTTSGGTDVLSYTDNGTSISVTNSSLSLTDGQTYYVSVRAYDQAGNVSGVGTSAGITVDAVGPSFTNITASSTTTGFSVTWTSTEASTDQLEYGTTTSYGSTTVVDSAAATSHSATVTGLSSGTTYHFRIIGTDQLSNTNRSADQTVTTTAAAVSTPPTTPSTTPTETPSSESPSPSSVTTPRITNLGNGSVIADTRPIVAGTGPAGAAIFVLADRQLVRTVLADTSGRFHVTLSEPLSLGTHQFVVRARTASGDVSDESEPISVTITTSSALATVQRVVVSDGAHPSVTYYAVAPAHSTIHFLLDGVKVKTLHAEDVDQAYGFITTLNVPTSLVAGQHQYSFFTVDQYGRQSRQVGTTIFRVGTTITSTVAPSGTTIQYRVQSGDSLWSIAQRFIGTGSQWPKIVALNTSAHPSLNTSAIIRSGWLLTLPTRSP